MRRLLFLLVLGFLLIDATGVIALMRAEPCTSAEDTQPDGACPPMCVRCACGVQVVVPAIAAAFPSAPLREMFVDRYSLRAPRSMPSKIFHVPKLISPTA